MCNTGSITGPLHDCVVSVKSLSCIVQFTGLGICQFILADQHNQVIMVINQTIINSLYSIIS